MQTLLADDVVLSEDDFIKISQMVYDHCGINLHDGKKELVRARLAKRLRLGKFTSFPEYMDYVFADKTGREFSMLIDSLSTNLTGFFRESQHFEFMRDKFLPAIMERKKKVSNFKIRGWSAGCSSGQEPYSIAITVLDAIRGSGRWDTKILATDISTKVLEVAKAGTYEAEKLESNPDIKKHFVQSITNHRKTFTVNQYLKDAIIFRYLNLMGDWPIRGPLDFIFCRNVMIYFDKPTQSNLVNRFWDLLGSGGILFTGHSESLTGIEHKFSYVQPTIYLKP